MDPRDGILILGTVNTGTHNSTSDTIRLNKLQDELQWAKIISMGQRQMTDTGTTLQSSGGHTPTHLSGDFTSQRNWTKQTRGDPDTILSRNITILILDYYFLTINYFRPDGMYTYGSQWFTMILPSFFKNKGKIAFLPNDKWGEVIGMWNNTLTNQQHRKSYEIELIKTEDLERLFPLWKATELANRDPAWQSITEHQKTNGTARKNLNQSYPIIMVYNTEEFSTIDQAHGYIKTLASTNNKPPSPPIPQEENITTNKYQNMTPKQQEQITKTCVDTINAENEGQLVIRRSAIKGMKPDRDRGVFASRTYSPGDLTDTYRGVEITYRALKQRYPENLAEYAFQAGPNKYIDAQDPRDASAARWINGAKGQAINVKARWANGAICIYATKIIREGDELLMDYDPNNDRKHGYQIQLETTKIQKCKTNARKKSPTFTWAEPIQDKDGWFEWPGLEVKMGRRKAGWALYCKQHLPPDYAIPLVGRDVTQVEIHTIHDETHRWTHTGLKGQTNTMTIDGKPLPGELIACRGLAIGLMANEPDYGKAPNCRYHANHLITTRRIRKGEQLTVYYGPGYASIRKALNYRVDDEYLLDYCENDTPPPTCTMANCPELHPQTPTACSTDTDRQ